MAQKRITVDPNRMCGMPCIRDTRVTASAVLGQFVAAGSIDEVLADYPDLERNDILAALEYTIAHRRLMSPLALSDVGVRAHRLAESPEGDLITDEMSIRHLLGL